jgi:RNA polymerase sigma factor (sigma-70 family)
MARKDQGMSSQDSKLTTSDQELIDSARSGDTSAFAELWRRHYRSAARVARQFTSSIDADDLVSEAYARIFQRVLAGGGPTGAFRPYLYTTIRNLASSWGAAASKNVQVEVIEEFEDERIPDDPAAWALDRTLTAKAFRALPERWQTVLWYTEVEGMDPHEVAPLMGLTANGVAALSYRAREGLRTAWLQAHISNAGTSADCRWTISRLGDRARNGLTARENQKVEQHLLVCTKCSVISDEVEEVGSHLALVMIPLLLGGVAGGALLASLAHPSAALAAEIIPALPPAVHAVATTSATAAPILGGIAMGASSGAGALVGSLAVIAVIGGGVVLGVAAPGSPLAVPAPSSHHVRAPSADSSSPHVSAPLADSVSAPPADPANTSAVGTTVDRVGSATNSVVGGATGIVNGLTAPVVTPLTGGAPAVSANVDLHLSGTGTPGAGVSAQVAGSVYTTVVASDGSWSITVAGLPQTVTGADAQITQKAPLIAGILGALLAPLTVDVNPLGLHLTLLSM